MSPFSPVRRAALALLCTLPLGALQALPFHSGEAQVQLIELYTSEGCSSCPPADAHLSTLKSDPGLWRERVPVAFHVDYWDYIGWQDPFASAENSLRQRTHAARGNLGSVYTPGFVVDGAEWRGFFRRAPWPLPGGSLPGRLSLDYADGQVAVRFAPQRGDTGDLRLQLAWLGSGLQTAVKRGENRGRMLAHDFVVLAQQTRVLGAAGGYAHRGEFAPGALPEAERYALVAWLEDRRGRPVQAVGGWVESSVVR